MWLPSRRFLRSGLLGLCWLAAGLTLAGGGLAVLGRLRWGSAWWYCTTAPDYRLRCGRELMRRGETDRVEQVAVRLLAAGHRDHALLLRAEALFQQGKAHADAGNSPRATPLLLRATETLNKIRDTGALRLEAQSLLGQCYLYLKQPNEAARAFQFVLSQQPDQIDAHRGLAALYYDQGAMGRAIAHLQEVARLDPADGRPYRLMALIFKESEQFPQAASCYEEALRRQLHGQNPADLCKELAECLVRQTKYAPALEVLERFAPRPEDLAAVEALRGECLWGAGRAPEARAVLDRALARYPDCLDLLVLRAKLHLENGEPRPAVDLLQRAVALDRYDYASHYQLALAYRQLGRSPEAEEQQRLYAQIRNASDEVSRLTHEANSRPWDAALRRRLAELCEQLGKLGAAKMWRQAAATCPALGTGPGSQPTDASRLTGLRPTHKM